MAVSKLRRRVVFQDVGMKPFRHIDRPMLATRAADGDGEVASIALVEVRECLANKCLDAIVDSQCFRI